MNIVFIRNRIVFGTGGKLYEIDLTQQDCYVKICNLTLPPSSQYVRYPDGITEEPPSSRDKYIKLSADPKIIEYTVKQDHVKEVKIHKDYRFIEFIDIGSGKNAMMLEDKVFREIKFVLLAIKPRKQTLKLKDNSTEPVKPEAHKDLKFFHKLEENSENNSQIYYQKLGLI